MANNNISGMTYEGIKSRGIANDLWAPFERAEAYPMDITSVFGSYETAASYAKNGATSYAGQTIAVAGTGLETKAYKITSGGTLVELVDAIALNLKQDVIDDIDEIRSGAKSGATALQKVPEKYAEKEWVSDNYGNLTDVNSLKTKVTTLIGEDSGKTVRTIANEEIAAKLIPEDAQESLDTLAEIAAWIQEHPEDAAKMNLDITSLKESAHTHSNKNILDDISQANINAWTNPSKAISANTAVSATCLYNKNYPGYGIDVKYIAKGDDFGGSESYYTYISVNGESNFNNMAHFNDGIHLCNGGASRGGVIYFGDNVDKDELFEGEEIYPYAYIGERLDDTIEIKSSNIAIGNIGNDILTNEDGETVYDENEQPIHTGEYKVDGIFIGLDKEDNFDEGESVSSLTLNKGLRIVTNDNEESYGATLNIPLNVEDSVNANSVYADNIPNTIKFNGKSYSVSNRTVDLGDLINSANTAKIADEAKYVDAKDIDGILGVEHLPIGTTSGSVASGDHTHIEIGSMLNDISGSVASLFTKTDENAENIEDQGLVLQDYNEILTNHEERIQTVEATSLSNKSRIDKIEDNVLVLNETRGSKVVSLRSFHLNELSCLTQAPDTIYLGKINGGDYIRPNSNLNGVTIVNETFAPNWSSSIGYDGFCNNIIVEAENIRYIYLLNGARPYLICKVTNASCVLPHNAISTGITKSFGLMRSNLTVSGITGTKYYSYPIYSGDTIAIPLSADNLMPSNFIYENEIGTTWDSGNFSAGSIYFLYGTSSLVLMSKIYDYDIYASYGQEITGSMDDTNLPIDKDIIIDNIESVHDLILPSSPKLGKKYNIITKANRCTLDGNGKIIYQNYTLDTTAIAGYDKLSLENKVSNCIYDGTTWYLY